MTPPPMSAEYLGPVLRLWGIPSTSLPPPTALPSELAPFLLALLQEAVPFLDSIAPKSPLSPRCPSWKPKGTKTFSVAPSSPVSLYERTVPLPALELICARNQLPHASEGTLAPETWACRRSVHADAARRGTASWGEFVRCFKEFHAQAEKEFTPSIVGARTARTWRCDGVEGSEGGVLWGAFTMKVEESRHALGGPMKDRAFAVLQVTCEAMGKGGKECEFIVVSIALTDFGESELAMYCKEKGVVGGRYTSVERIRKLEKKGREGDGEGEVEIEWIMATASDAKGALPQWLQTMAVPGQIAKDVQLFLSWAAKEREIEGVADDDDGRPSAESEAGSKSRARGMSKGKGRERPREKEEERVGSAREGSRSRSRARSTSRSRSKPKPKAKGWPLGDTSGEPAIAK